MKYDPTKTTRAIVLILAASLAACSTATMTKTEQDLSQFLQSPAGKALTSAVEGAATTAVDEYVGGGKLHGNQIASAALSGASSVLRTTQGTGAAANPAAVTNAVKTGADNPAIANTVAPAVANAIASAKNADSTTNPSIINEAAARALDTVAAKKLKP